MSQPSDRMTPEISMPNAADTATTATTTTGQHVAWMFELAVREGRDHLFERYMARFFDVLAPKRLTLYGAPDERVRAALAQLGPPVMSRAAGFRR